MALSNAFLSRLRELSDEAQPQRQVPSPTSNVRKSGQRQAETPTVQNPSMNVQPAGWAGMAAARGTSASTAGTQSASEGPPGADVGPWEEPGALPGAGDDYIEYGGGGGNAGRYAGYGVGYTPHGNIGPGVGFGNSPLGYGIFPRYAQSTYPTTWSYQPGAPNYMGWVPAAQAVGGGYGGHGGMWAGGGTGPGSSAWGSGYSSSYTGAQNTGGNLYPRLQT